MGNEFPTIDITKMTPQEKVMEMVGETARPGKACELSSGFIKEDEVVEIANSLGISINEVKEAFLREVKAYNSKLYKPKHEPNNIRLGNPYTGTIHKAPHGKCVFLDKNHPNEHVCLLGEKMPLHCKMSVKGEHGEKLNAWYLLNHAVKAYDPHSLREWAIYLKTHPTIPGGQLEELVPSADKLRSILESDDYHVEVQDTENIN